MVGIRRLARGGRSSTLGILWSGERAGGLRCGFGVWCELPCRRVAQDGRPRRPRWFRAELPGVEHSYRVVCIPRPRLGSGTRDAWNRYPRTARITQRTVCLPGPWQGSHEPEGSALDIASTPGVGSAQVGPSSGGRTRPQAQPQLTKGGSVKRLALLLAAAGVMAAATATSAAAAPPQPPGGCAVVVNTPAATTGSAQGQANKAATFNRLCAVVV